MEHQLFILMEYKLKLITNLYNTLILLVLNNKRFKKFKIYFLKRFGLLDSSRYVFSDYKKAFAFSDWMLYFYLLSIFGTLFVFANIFYFLGATHLTTYFFYYSIFPMVVYILFALVPYSSNLRKKELLRKKAVVFSEKYKNIFLSYLGENTQIEQNYEIGEYFEFKASHYVNWKFEVLERAYLKKADAVLKCAVSSTGFVYGYYGYKFNSQPNSMNKLGKSNLYGEVQNA